MLVQKLPIAADVCVIGGGASGFYAAIACAERAVCNGYQSDILILEKSNKLLHKVSISGGGRCNVLHRSGASFKENYPRGAQLMEHLRVKHGAIDSMQWFESKGVKLKTEADGRVFPLSNTSKSIVDCFLSTARSLGIKVLENAKVLTLRQTPVGFGVTVEGAQSASEIECKRLLICTGSAQKRSAQALLQDAGATICPVAPSLFSLQFARTTAPKFQGMEGLSVPDARVQVLDHADSRGAVLITHGGISGPAILRLSAWAAYAFQELDYKAVLNVDWAPHLTQKDMAQSIMDVPGGRVNQPPVRRKAVGDVSPWPGVLPARLWQQLLRDADSQGELTNHFGQLSLFRRGKTCASTKMPLTQWPWKLFRSSEAAKVLGRAMFTQVTCYQIAVDGRRLNKEEFVTAGGVSWSEGLDWNRMESKTCPGVHFAGEAVDVDGITGGFNFQGCWSSGYVAGVAAADALYPQQLSVTAKVARSWNQAWHAQTHPTDLNALRCILNSISSCVLTSAIRSDVHHRMWHSKPSLWLKNCAAPARRCWPLSVAVVFGRCVRCRHVREVPCIGDMVAFPQGLGFQTWEHVRPMIFSQSSAQSLPKKA